MHVLVLNSGSFSLKFRLFEVGEYDNSSPKTLLTGSVKGIREDATLELTIPGQPERTSKQLLIDQSHATQWMFDSLEQSGSPVRISQIEAVGHRVVHGGERFSAPTFINHAVEKEIDGLSELAPLHNPACLAGIRGARTILGERVITVAVFDTAFLQTMPAVAKTYALPDDLASRHRIHRYGFHGIAHASLDFSMPSGGVDYKMPTIAKMPSIKTN